MNTIKKLTDINNSGDPYIIYKSNKGFDLYTNFSKKIILNKKNIHRFLNKKKISHKSKNTDLFIGFFGYELLNNLIGVKIPKQKNINFPQGIFYKPEKKLSFTNNLFFKNDNNNRFKSKFKIILMILTCNYFQKDLKLYYILYYNLFTSDRIKAFFF